MHDLFNTKSVSVQLLPNDEFKKLYAAVETIANEHGFESTIYFRRLFKKLSGKTPTQYRNEERLL